MQFERAISRHHQQKDRFQPALAARDGAAGGQGLSQCIAIQRAVVSHQRQQLCHFT